ncbi:MAG TPA: hypothetical protein VHA78_06290 [Candidatus Peribacteraceae bacterium]|nr:hypothetical protein [Candidatus Peribacteraceae bacterium]
MADFMDHLPSHERERIRKRMRSPEAYEALRERVKGPEDLEKEMQRSERMAELNFTLESEPKIKDRLKSQIEKDMREQGIDAVMESEKIPDDVKKMIEQGKFTVAVSSHPSTHDDALIIMPEGNVQEKIPVKQSLSDQYAAVLVKE